MKLRLDRWLLGFPVLAAIWVYCVVSAGPRIEDRLRAAVQRVEEGRSTSPLRGLGAHVELKGRDAVIVADLGLPEGVRSKAEREAAGVTGVRRVTTEVTEPVEMAPFPLVVTRRGPHVVLTGGVPSAALHAAFLDRVYEAVPADNVDDRLRLGRGEPPGFSAAARFLLDAVLRLPKAEGALTGRVFTFKGTAAQADAYNAVAAMLANPPPGFAPGLVDLNPPIVSPFVWRAVKTPDSLMLEGNVPSEAERRTLAAAARASGGADDVIDRMQTARGLRPGLDFLALARASIAALGQVGSGRADLSGAQFKFAGNVVARDAFASIEGDLRRGLPGGLEIGPITIGTQPASPFSFTARRGDGRITLAGYVPDSAEKSAILDGARTLFVGEDVVDRLHEADGAPEGFRDAAAVALDRLADLADGEARISDRTLRLTGRSLYAQLAQRIGASLPSAVPAGWTASARIRTSPAEPPLDAARCGDLLGDVVRRQPIRFATGAAEPNAASMPAIRALADVVRRCGAATIEVSDRPLGQIGPTLVDARAQAVARALGAGGVEARVTAAAAKSAEAVAPAADSSGTGIPSSGKAVDAGPSTPAEPSADGTREPASEADAIEFIVRP